MTDGRKNDTALVPVALERFDLAIIPRAGHAELVEREKERAGHFLAAMGAHGVAAVSGAVALLSWALLESVWLGPFWYFILIAAGITFGGLGALCGAGYGLWRLGKLFRTAYPDHLARSEGSAKLAREEGRLRLAAENWNAARDDLEASVATLAELEREAETFHPRHAERRKLEKVIAREREKQARTRRALEEAREAIDLRIESLRERTAD